MALTRGLTAADVEAIACRVVELLRDEFRLSAHVDTTAVATMLGVSGDWVREHAAELGAIRIGDSPTGALRVRAAACEGGAGPASTRGPRASNSRRPGPARRLDGVELLPLPDEA